MCDSNYVTVPLHPPLNVQTYNTSSRSLRVTWDLVPAEWRFGIVLGYHVIITDTRDGQEYLNDVKANANRSLERAGFERYTNYTVKVAAYTIKGTGNFSEAIRVLTDEDGTYKIHRESKHCPRFTRVKMHNKL